MAATEIDRSNWAPFLDTVTNSLMGKQAEIEVVSLDLGDQIEAEWTPLALEWATTRGSRSGRVAWQFVQDLAGRKGVRLS